MNIFKNISNGYKKIATGIAIVSFLAVIYIALIPGASLAFVYGPNGGVLSGAFVFIKEWPQYNATTAPDGSYAINDVPVGDYTLVAMGNDSLAPNISSITVTEGNTNFHDLQLKSAINSYLPFLYQRQDNIYDAAIQVWNNGASDSSIEMILYNKNGTLAGNDFKKVSPGKLISVHPFEITGPLTLFNAAAKLKSDSNNLVQGYIYTVGEQVYSIAPSYSEASTANYLPFLYQRQDNIYDAGIQMYNPGTATANVNVILYWKNGTVAANNNYVVDPKNQLTKLAFDMVIGESIFNGPATITSDLPIVVQGFIRTKASNIYSIAPALNVPVTEVYLPFLYQRQDNIYDAGVQLFNSGTVPANVNVVLYWKNGTVAANNNYVVDPKNQLTKMAFDMVIGESIFNGPVKITSDVPILVQGFIRTKAYNVYSIAPMVRKPASAGVIHIPFMYSTTNLSHDAGIQVFNPNGVPANVVETLYYPDGTLAGSANIAFAANESITKMAFDIATNTINFNGYAIISADQPVVAQGFIRQKTKNIYSIAPPVER